jgi:hypothetical protein
VPTNLLSPRLARWLSDHHGVVTTQELRAVGVGRTATDRLCTGGVLRRITRGVFVATLAAPTLEHRSRVLCCLHPAGFVTGPTAGMLAGLRRQPRWAGLHFSIRHGVHLDEVDGVVYRQTTALRACDRTVRADGIVVSSFPRLAFDLAADLGQLDHRSVVEQLLDRRLVTADELAAIGRRLCHPARRGSTTFRRTVLGLGGEPHDSHPEVVLHDALRALGVPVEAQVPVRCPADGVTIHVDLAVSAVRWGIELDIHPEHRSVDGHQRDSRRVRGLHDTDWQIEPVSELDMAEPRRLAAELAELYRRRIRVFGAPPLRGSALGRASTLG